MVVGSQTRFLMHNQKFQQLLNLLEKTFLASSRKAETYLEIVNILIIILWKASD